MLLICIQLYIIAFLPDSPRWLLAKKTPSGIAVLISPSPKHHLTLLSV